MQKNKKKEMILIILTTIIFILVAMNSMTYFRRIDLTENKVFTISSATKQIISSMPERMHITYFISDRIKAITPVASAVEDLLFEYAAHSRGRITVTSVDPARAGMVRMAESFGVEPQQIEVFEQNERAIATVYSGIVIQYLDRIETIPFTLSLATLEFDLTYRIRKLVYDIEVSLGLLIGDNRRSVEEHYSFLYERIRRVGYNIEVVNPGHEIPSSISVLAVVGNRDLTDGDMLYVDEFIMNGGRVLFALDGVDVDPRDLATLELVNSPAIEMLRKYGVTINNDFVLDKSVRRIPLRGMFPMPYPQWIAILGQNVSRDNPITNRFSGLDLLWASSITIEEKEGLTYEPLVSTTDQAWILDTVTTDPNVILPLMSYTSDAQRQFNLGYVVSGTFRSAFTDKTSRDTRIIVISDSDFVSNIIEFSDSPHNIIFFENAVEWLSSDESLLQIKTRATRDPRLNKIEDPEKRVTAIIIVYLVNIVIIPLLIIIFAIFHFVRRKKREA
ncbi:MAG: GldG family protein [Spirochaetaceae bacterium]|nr:GldG family protein [Spirochaetaceae bacterium]